MKKVLDFAQRFDLLPRYELMLVAASGGMDSMCLLDFLYENGYRVCAAHFNHRLRGEESDLDEELVRAWCAARRIPLCVGSEDVAEYAASRGVSVEEAARELRYDFLNRMAEQTRAVRIVTAHHANDTAETVLFHLARGTGLTGLTGIAPRRGVLVRPFLCLTREEIASYAKEHHVPYRTDSSNADKTYTRNYVRAEIVPRMEQINPQAVEHIADTALRLRQEDAFLDSLAAERLTEIEASEDQIVLPCAAVAQAPEVLRPRMLRLALDALNTGKKDISAVHYDALVTLCLGTGCAQLDLPDGVTVQRADGMLTLRRERREETLPRLALKENDTVYWGAYRIACRKEQMAEQADDGMIRLRTAALDEPVTVGVWSARESMTLPVSRGSRSLKRLFSERGIEPSERDAAPVIRVGEAVAAVYGIGTDALFLPSAGESVLVIDIQKAAEPPAVK